MWIRKQKSFIFYHAEIITINVLYIYINIYVYLYIHTHIHIQNFQTFLKEVFYIIEKKRIINYYIQRQNKSSTAPGTCRQPRATQGPQNQADLVQIQL